MGRVLLEGSIIVLLVLIGVSIFVPQENNVSNIITEFEDSVENGNMVNDGQIENVEISIEDSSNLISKINCKIANSIVNGLNNIFELGMKILRDVIG